MRAATIDESKLEMLLEYLAKYDYEIFKVESTRNKYDYAGYYLVEFDRKDKKI